MYTYQHSVQYYETDKMGVTHHSNYIRWMEESRVGFLADIGLDYALLEQRGLISPVIGLNNIKYKKPTTFGDVVNIEVYIKEYNGIVIVFNYTMKNKEGAVVFVGESEHCFLSPQGKMIILKSAFPDLDEILSKKVGE